MRRRVVKKCKSCGKVLDPQYQKKYCSNQCQQDYQWEQRKRQIAKLGIEKSQKVAKRYLIEVRGMKCSICGLEEWRDQTVPLVLDHINGHPEDNRIENLRLVCGNCDMQLPTYKSKNYGNGRAYRRQRYKNGKSY
jgi:predicted nucleic acid-binding Zn ribbon protein